MPEKVDLRSNPLPIPEALLGPRQPWDDPGDLQTILNFYFQTQDPEAQPLYEAKLLIIGEGGAGKTTMAKKIQDPDYELKPLGSEDPEQSTEGIDIIQWQFDQPNNQSFRVNIWDFGGQEVYHATHQFFLTKRSLYALVVDNRREQINFYYWLNIVRLLSESSPIFIVKNEVQNRQCEINEGQYRVEFENLKPSVRANFDDNRGLDAIQAAIQQHITTLPEIQDPWPHKWLKVRYALENDQSNYITQDDYLRLCHINGIPNKVEALQVSGLLHSLGICLHFQDDPALKHYFILSPTWVTDAVYKVTDNKKVQADLGRFSRDDLNDIWSDGEYAEMKDELLQLMQKFFICYPLRDRPGTYIAPSLLSVERPNYCWDDEKNLVLRYEYPFMPKGMLTRLIVEMHRFIEPDESVPGLVWKTGVVLRSNSARAQVLEDYDQRKFSIRVVGHQRKTLLEQIRYELAKIHASYPNLEYSELIPCNCSTCKDSPNPHAYPYKKLVEFINNGRFDERCDKKPYETVDIRQLISDFPPVIEKAPDAPGTPLTAAPAQSNSSPIIINNQIHQESPKTMTVQNQTNHSGVNFQNDISGGQVNQGETINVTTNNNQGASIGNFANQVSDNASQNHSSSESSSAEIDPTLTTILFLAANPISTNRLRLDEELRDIDESLKRSQHRDQFNLVNRGAVRSRDFYRAILDSQPKIVHFSGHGSDLDGLALEDDQGNATFLGAEQLAALFEMFAEEGVECVLLNACYSKAQAQAIRQHIPHVIGMNQAITDKAGIEFAVAFYDCLGAGKDVKFAFKLAKSQLIPLGEHKIPELL